LQKLLTNYFAA